MGRKAADGKPVLTDGRSPLRVSWAAHRSLVRWTSLRPTSRELPVHVGLAKGVDMEEPPGGPRNPYEQASDRMPEQDRTAARAYAAAPLGPFLLRQLLWGFAGGVLGYLLGGWVWALVMFLGWGLEVVAEVRQRGRRALPPSPHLRHVSAE